MKKGKKGGKHVGYYREGARRFGGPRRGPANFGPKPVEEGKEYEVDIKEVSRRGEGIARIEGFVVFVPNTKAGDHVKIKISKISNRFATAEVVQ
ncbi:MAG: TRAM domain-containing protein [Candidatus Methanomethylicaceae archaeon]